MDPVTHFILGAALAQACLGRHLKLWAIPVGGLAAIIPDLDVLIYTGNPVLDHSFHRTFMHSLLFLPILGVLAALPFLCWKKLQPLRTPILAAAILAALSHGLLDACTSYGTQLFWPFSFDRIAWDFIAIIDPVFTGILALGVLAAARKRTPIPARIVLFLAAGYLTLAAEQHGRALDAQQRLAAARHETIDRGRALPTLGNIIAWRSLYQSGNTLHADALRISLSGLALRGEATIVPTVPLSLLGSSPAAQRDARLFYEFADGYIAWTPNQPTVLGDMRYSLTSGTFSPFWGIQLPVQPDTPAEWTTMNRRAGSNLRLLWDNLSGNDTAYTPVPESP